MSQTPPLGGIDLSALADAIPDIGNIDLSQLYVADGNHSPPLNSIDLSQLPVYTPALSGIDLQSFGSDGSDIEDPVGSGDPELLFLASGVGVGTSAGIGATSIEVSAVGVGYRPNAGSSEVDFYPAGEGVSGFLGSGNAALSFGVTGNAYQDWLSVLPPLNLREVYRLIITGANDGMSDLTIGGISSWQATNQGGGRESYVQAVIPAADRYIAGIEARQNGELVIQKGYRLADGSERYEEILRSRFDSLRPDRGRYSITVTVSGYLPGKLATSGSRVLTGIRNMSTLNGKRRVRCDVDLFLRPGMEVTALDESFRADYINYYVNRSDKFCEVGER